MLSHTNLMHNSASISLRLRATRARGMGMFWLPSYHDMGLVGGILQPIYIGRPNVLMSPMAFLQRPFRWLQAISRYRGHDQRRAELRLRSVRPQDHARATRQARPEQLGPGVQRRRAGASRNARRFAEDVRALRLPPRGVLSLLRPGRSDADGLRRLQSRPCPSCRTFDAKSTRKRRRADRCLADGSQGAASWSAAAADAAGSEDRDRQSRNDARVAPHDEVGEIWVSGPSVAQGYWQPPRRNRTHLPRPIWPTRARGRSCAPATWASSRTANCSSPAGSRI